MCSHILTSAHRSPLHCPRVMLQAGQLWVTNLRLLAWKMIGMRQMAIGQQRIQADLARSHCRMLLSLVILGVEVEVLGKGEKVKDYLVTIWR